jgi:orotate phosphoribosyltransferase
MNILEEFEQAGAISLDKHFVYKSGTHGPHYINTDPLFPRTMLMTELVDAMMEPFLMSDIEVVTGPPTGGMVLAIMAAARWPGILPPALVWTAKYEYEEDGKSKTGFRFDRAGFTDYLPGKRVLILEDLLNTGGSAIEVREELEKYDAQVIGVSAICNRGTATAETLGVEQLEVQAAVHFEAHDPEPKPEEGHEGCPLCIAGIPIVDDIGHGADYKAEHPDYPGGYESLLSS